MVELAWYQQAPSLEPGVLLSEGKNSEPLTLLLCKFLISCEGTNRQGPGHLVNMMTRVDALEDAKGMKAPHLREYFLSNSSEESPGNKILDVYCIGSFINDPTIHYNLLWYFHFLIFHKADHLNNLIQVMTNLMDRPNLP